MYIQYITISRCVLFLKRANQLTDIIEQSLIERYHTRPLMASQFKRFREVQLPHGKKSTQASTPIILG